MRPMAPEKVRLELVEDTHVSRKTTMYCSKLYSIGRLVSLRYSIRIGN